PFALAVLAAFVVFFFFQAEDGIRDLIVTGVQTCALPIYRLVEGGAGRDAVALRVLADEHRAARLGREADDVAPRVAAGQQTGRRSEERRVGEEGRAGWSPEE